MLDKMLEVGGSLGWISPLVAFIGPIANGNPQK